MITLYLNDMLACSQLESQYIAYQVNCSNLFSLGFLLANLNTFLLQFQFRMSIIMFPTVDAMSCLDLIAELPPGIAFS